MFFLLCFQVSFLIVAALFCWIVLKEAKIDEFLLLVPVHFQIPIRTHVAMYAGGCLGNTHLLQNSQVGLDGLLMGWGGGCINCGCVCRHISFSSLAF